MVKNQVLSPGPRLLATVIVSAAVGCAVGISASWALYSHLGPAREIIGSPHTAGSGATVSSIEAKTLASIVTISTQPVSGPVTVNQANLVSGFVVSGDGLVVTSMAAIHGATRLSVGTADGHTFTAAIAATDVVHGIAVLRLRGASGLTPLSFASTTPNLGDVALTVARPPLLAPTIRAGAVSAESYELANVSTPAVPLVGVLVVDANPVTGGEGSPLLDANGNVIGVVTLPPQPPVPGLYALSGNAAAVLVSQVQRGAAQAYVNPGFLATDLDPATAAAAGVVPGALVTEVTAGSPAELAGLKAGDIISAVNGASVTPSATWAETLAALTPDQQLDLGVWRDGARLTVTFPLPAL